MLANGSQFTFGANTYAINYSLSGVQLDVVPEPSTYMLSGVGLLFCAQRFRRRNPQS